MPHIDSNDPPPFAVDPVVALAYSRAALVLVESLIHGLCETGALTAEQALEIVERAVDIQFDRATETDGVTTDLWKSHAILSIIAQSLRIDVEAATQADQLA